MLENGSLFWKAKSVWNTFIFQKKFASTPCAARKIELTAARRKKCFNQERKERFRREKARFWEIGEKKERNSALDFSPKMSPLTRESMIHFLLLLAKKAEVYHMKTNHYSNLLRQYPEHMTKEQMYQVCHISKKTCLFLLQSGLVHCLDSGKKTRRFKIETADVIRYLEDRELHPDRYKPPDGFYKRKRVREKSRRKKRRKPETDTPSPSVAAIDPHIMREFYKVELGIYPDDVSNGQNAEIGQIYDTILSYMLSYMTLPSFMSAVSTTAPQEELPYDGSTYSLTLTDTNNVIGNYSFSASDTAVSVEVSGNQLILRSASPLSAPVTVVAIRNSAYTAASTFTPYGSTTRQDIVVGVEAVGGMTGYLTLKANRKEFRVAVTKEDGITGTAQGDGTLTGAAYGLYHGDTLIETCTTDANGQFTTGYYEAGGGWTIREISPSPGYLLDTTVYPVPAAADQLPSIKNDLTLTMKETPILGRLSISKLAVNSAAGAKAPEAGASFEVFLKSAGSYDAAAETERDILTCGEDGTAQSKLLPYGVYIVRQLSGWEGYALDTTRHEVNISSDGETVSIQLRNEIFKGSLTIRKVDKDTEQALPGARFRLLDNAGNPFAEGTTDESGVLTFDNLPFGDYYLEELEAPNGYKIDRTPYVFSVTADGQKIEIRRENTRIPGSVTVAKTDSSGNPIPGAAFRLEYSEDGETWTPVFHNGTPAKEVGGCTSESLSDGMLITGDDGIAVFGGLRAGDGILYRVTEIATVNGYVLLTEPVELGTLPRESEESTIYNVSVTISNSPTYLLPMTGGTGLWPVLSAGFTAACMGLFLIIISKNKRRDCMQ